MELVPSGPGAQAPGQFRMIPSSKLQAPSSKLQASSSKLQAPRPALMMPQLKYINNLERNKL